MANTIGIDVGGTGIKAATVDVSQGTLISDRKRIATPQPATPQAVGEVIGTLLRQLGGAELIGVTLPAVIADGVVSTAANIDESWLFTETGSWMRSITDTPSLVLNDADAAGIAEMRFGAGRGQEGTVVMITLGTGIGSALFHQSTLVPNTEFGHLHLHHGDAEEWAAESARVEDELSWKEWSSRVSAYLCHLEELLWPDLFIIGGGVSRHAEKFIPRLETRTKVVPAQLENAAGIVGAAIYAHEQQSRLVSTEDTTATSDHTQD